MQENKMQENEIETAEVETETVKEESPKADKGDKKKVKKLEEELAAANAKADELNDRYVRMLAEYDNFRKRSAKEREGVYADAYIDALTNILPVLDNLERAEGCEDAEEKVGPVFHDRFPVIIQSSCCGVLFHSLCCSRSVDRG